MHVVLQKGDVLVVHFENVVDKVGLHWRDEHVFSGIVVTEISGSSDDVGRGEVLYEAYRP